MKYETGEFVRYTRTLYFDNKKNMKNTKILLKSIMITIVWSSGNLEICFFFQNKNSKKEKLQFPLLIHTIF